MRSPHTFCSFSCWCWFYFLTTWTHRYLVSNNFKQFHIKSSPWQRTSTKRNDLGYTSSNPEAAADTRFAPTQVDLPMQTKEFRSFAFNKLRMARDWSLSNQQQSSTQIVPNHDRARRAMLKLRLYNKIHLTPWSRRRLPLRCDGSLWPHPGTMWDRSWTARAASKVLKQDWDKIF